MELHFLGTAAAEGWPALFCQCPACSRARQTKGRDIRTRSSVQVDGVVQFDLTPDLHSQALREELELAKVEHLLITHSHHDHWAYMELGMRGEVFAHRRPPSALTVYGNAEVIQKGSQGLGDWQGHQTRLVEAEPFEPFQMGPYLATPLLADHSPRETCLIWLLERDGVRLLYGNDTGYFPEETWSYLVNTPLNGVLLDCTSGPLRCRQNHMGIETVVEVKERLADQWSLAPGAQVIATHFSHNGGFLYSELVEALDPHGIGVAYDGLRVRLAP